MANSTRILFGFSTTDIQPFDGLRRQGIERTWTRWIELPHSVYPILAVSTLPPMFTRLICRICFAYERARYKSYGRLTTALARILMRPLAFIEPKSYVQDGEIRVATPETTTFMGYKLLVDIKMALDGEFDFLVHTNSSSFINVKGIQSLLEQQDPNLDFYGGKVLPVPLLNGISGCFTVLSKESMGKIWKSRKSWIHALLDDVALAKIMQNLEISRTLLPSIDAKSSEVISSLTKADLNQILHYKCGPSFEDGFRIDDRYMRMLWERYNA